DFVLKLLGVQILRRGPGGAWQQKPPTLPTPRAPGDRSRRFSQKSKFLIRRRLCVFRRLRLAGNSHAFPCFEALMTDQAPPVDEMHYEQLAQDALRGVIRLALERAAMPEGIPGAHHFYITFKTRAAGVSVPP